MKQFYFLIALCFLVQTGWTMSNDLEITCPTVEVSKQSFCERYLPVVGDLVAVDQGSGVAWYSSNTSTTPLNNDTPLFSGTYYVGTSTATCQGNRSAVTVEVAETPNAGSSRNLTYSSDDPAVDLLTLIGPTIFGEPDAGGSMDPPLKSGSTIFDPSVDGDYTGGPRHYTYIVSSSNDICTNSSARVRIVIEPQPNSSHRLIHYGDTPQETYYNQQHYTPASPDEGVLYNIWGDGPLELGSIYKITTNGLPRYYYVNNVYPEPEYNPRYTLTADIDIQKFTPPADTEKIGLKWYGEPLLSNTENYVYTRSPQIPVAEITSNIYEQEIIESVSYFDGLGRPKQQVSIRGGADEEDIITPVKYDEFGRQSKDFLPYARRTRGGEIHPEIIVGERIYNDIEANVQFYNTLKYDFTRNPYSEKEFEASPLNRVLKQTAPGESWKPGSGHEIEFDYSTNEIEEVRLFKVSFEDNNPAFPVLDAHESRYYDVGELYKTTTYDENHESGNNHSTEEFKDKQGRVVLKRTYADMDTSGDGIIDPEVAHDTYYVYDDYGNLTYVLPPKMDATQATSTELQNEMAAVGYQYRYDHRNRLIEKKLPGKGRECVVYNILNQPVLTQDADLREKGQWLYTKYDVFGRVTETGVFTSAEDTREGMQAQLDNFYSGDNPPRVYEERQGQVYINRSFPNTAIEALTINYYDNYNFDGNGLVIPLQNKYGQEITQSRTKGLATGSKVKVLETQDWITSVSGYDKKGRNIWSASKNNFLDTEDIVHIELDFVGKVERQTAIHQKTGQPTVETEDVFTYDHMGRQLTHTQNVNDGDEELIAVNAYDELGQLVRKNVGGNVPDQMAPPELGPAAYSELTNVEVRENGELWKVSGAFGDNGKAKMIKSLKGDGYVEFSPMSNTLFSVGLEYIDTENPENSYSYIIYVVRNFIKINEGGGNLEYAMPYQVNIQPGDILTVEREGRTILYKVNGETFYTSRRVSSGELQLFTSFRQIGPQTHYIKMVDLDEKDGGLQQVNYAYNIRGWLKNINDPNNLGSDLFGFGIQYDDPQNAATKALFNGNISETHWSSQSGNNTNNPVSNEYRYSYDALNRITGALDNTGNYNLGSVSYDKMGNILSLQRQGHLDANVTLLGNMDQLQYTYNEGNQLMAVTDSSTSLEGFKDGNKGGDDYGYDDNGNLTSDLNKGITEIQYNHLNMPTKVTVTGANAGVLDYTYSADGIKLRKKKTVGNTEITTDYAGDFVYENNNLKQFYQPEGYVEPDGSGWQYVYQYRDIWRNTRITYADDDNSGYVTSAEIRREQNYYPFGLEHRGYNSSSYGVKNNIKTYQGQEFTEDLGLNTHEWKYRISDPSIGRFWQIDPLAEKYYYNSPYAFQENKLGSGIELEGLENVLWSKLSASVGAKIEQAKNFIFNQIKYDMQTIDNEGNYHSATLQSARQSGLEQNKYFADTREMVQSVTNNSDGSIQYGKDFQLSDNPDASQKLSLNLDVGFKEQTGEVSMPLMGGVKVLSQTEGDWKANLTINSAGETVIIGPKLEAEYTQSATVPIPGLPGVSIGGKINAEGAASDLQSTSQNIINANNGNGVILNPYFNPFQQ